MPLLSRFVLALLAALAAAPVLAQAPPAHRASPGVYKVVAENEQFRVIEVTWRAGQKDAPHSHPASAAYFLTDCSLRLIAADGSSRDVTMKEGSAQLQAAIESHTVQNLGPGSCQMILVEIK